MATRVWSHDDHDGLIEIVNCEDGFTVGIYSDERYTDVWIPKGDTSDTLAEWLDEHLGRQAPDVATIWARAKTAAGAAIDAFEEWLLGNYSRAYQRGYRASSEYWAGITSA